MKITLIGMSNAGKSYWSEKLEKEQGYDRLCCDDLIEKKLESILKKQGYSGIEEVSEWMGQPYDKQYKQNSKQYLNCEISVMKEVIKLLENNQKNNKKIVIDTTGSVIYVDRKILSKLAQISKIVHIEIPLFLKKEMIKKYIENPKPVIWGDSYKKNNGETNKEALIRCYPELLDYRSKKYGKYANVTLDYFDVMNKRFNFEKFIRRIK